LARSISVALLLEPRGLMKRANSLKQLLLL
jgi:hypothetical protein